MTFKDDQYNSSVQAEANLHIELRVVRKSGEIFAHILCLKIALCNHLVYVFY